MLRVQPGGAHGTLEIKTQPFLNTAHSAALGKVQEQYKVQDNRSGKNAVAAEKIDLDLHGITEPAVDVDIIPSFFIIATGRVVMDADFVREILIKVRVKIGLKDLFQHRKLTLFLGFEGIRIIQNLSIAVP